MNYISIRQNTSTKQSLNTKVVIRSRNVNKIQIMAHKTINRTYKSKNTKTRRSVGVILVQYYLYLFLMSVMFRSFGFIIFLLSSYLIEDLISTLLLLLLVLMTD